MSQEQEARKSEIKLVAEDGQATQSEPDGEDVNEHLAHQDYASSQGEDVKSPLLSPKDRNEPILSRQNVRSSSFRQSKEINLALPEVAFQQDKAEPHLNHDHRLASGFGNRSHRHKSNSQSVPLLTVSEETSEGFDTQNIELDLANRDESGHRTEAAKPDKFADASYSSKTWGPSSAYSKNRRKGPLDAFGSQGKGHRGKAPRGLHPDLVRHWKWKYFSPDVPEPKKKLTKVELLKSFRLHFFVGLIFIITTVSVSLSWYYKNEAQEKLYSSQAIFFNPRTRELTLSDFSKSTRVRGVLGKDIPEWMLPLHCPIVMGDDPHNKECLWKKVAILKVSHFQEVHQQVQCYNVSWKSLSDKHLPHDCIYIDQATWYGPTNQSSSTFPIQGEFVYNPRVYKLNNNGLFNNVVDFYWLSSIGTAIYVNANNPIQVAWNISGSNQLCLKSNFSGSLYHQSNSANLPGMSYTLCQGTNAVKTHMFMQTMFAPQTPIEFPHTAMLSGTHWSLRKIMKTDNVSQSHVIQLVQNVTAKGFSNNVITMDGAWQKSHGDLVFDMDRFHNVTEMMEFLNTTDCLLTLCVSPYFQYRSQNFHAGAITNMFVRDAGGDVTGLTNFEGGQAAILDFFSESGRTWYNRKLQNLTKTHQIESYRLTYGQHSWLPYKPYFDVLDATPNMYRKLFTEQLSALVNLSLIVEHTSDSRHISSLISVSTRLSANRKCITGAVETALALGLIGYPFVMADGITVESKLSQTAPEVDNKPSRELYIRWIQLAALFPAYQYSIAPWEYDSDVVSIATNLSVLHNSFVLKEMRSKKLQEEVAHGLPILRPVWWLDSDNHTLHAEGIHDEFLIGDNLLVAPVLCEGVSERDIFIPSGYWMDVNDDKSFTEGPQHIPKHPVTLENIIMFKKIPVRGRGQVKMEL